MGYGLGVDLGTTYTAAGVYRDGRVEIATLGNRSAAIPSVVLLKEDESVLTGEAASRRGASAPQDPTGLISEYGTETAFDALADSCFADVLADCDTLYLDTPVSDSTNSYEGYGATCGGRLSEEDPGSCSDRG